jgi:uncharacterized protein (DUF2267 family)
VEEIVNQVSARTGLPPDQARAAVEAVVGILEERLPGPAAQALRSALGSPDGGSQPAAGGLLGGAQQALKRLLGGG